MKQETSKVGKRGTVVIPANIRRRLGIAEGSLVIAEEREDGVLFRPAVTLPIETYSKGRKAELLLDRAEEIIIHVAELRAREGRRGIIR